MPDLMQALRNADAVGDTEAATRIAAMIKKQEQPQETTAGEDAVGLLEAAATIGSGVIAEPIAGLGGIYEQATGGDPTKAISELGKP